MTPVETVAAFLLIGGGILYLALCFAAFAGLMKRPPSTESALPHVDIIIAARNEEFSIGYLLEDIYEQTYPADKLTVCVVDDRSTDGTAAVIASYAVRDSRILALSTADSLSPYTHKKRAVHEGILATGGDIIMTVDADCRVGSDWVSRMIACFAPEVELVAGEVLVRGEGLVAALENLDFTGIQMMSAGLMNAGFPITCNGANLAYRRESFDRVGGFDGVGRIVSGDDDLLMQKIARGRSGNVVYAIGSERAVVVEANETLAGFLSQRTRWASKTGSYPAKKVVALLALVFLFYVSLFLGFIAAMTGYIPAIPLLAALAMKISGDFLLTGYGIFRRGELRYLFLFPLAEILHVPYILYITLRGHFGTFEWHGRKSRAKA